MVIILTLKKMMNKCSAKMLNRIVVRMEIGTLNMPNVYVMMDGIASMMREHKSSTTVPHKLLRMTTL